jgi:hypothetical protein
MKILRKRKPQHHCCKDKELFSTCPNVNSNNSHPQISPLFQSVEETWYNLIYGSHKQYGKGTAMWLTWWCEVQDDSSTLEWNPALCVMRKQAVHVLCLQRRNCEQSPVKTSKKSGPWTKSSRKGFVTKPEGGWKKCPLVSLQVECSPADTLIAHFWDLP